LLNSKQINFLLYWQSFALESRNQKTTATESARWPITCTLQVRFLSRREIENHSLPQLFFVVTAKRLQADPLGAGLRRRLLAHFSSVKPEVSRHDLQT
jgi:hypothetical protein